MKSKWIFILAAPLLAIFMSGVRLYYMVEIWKYEGPTVEFEIAPGEPFSSINARLDKRKLISSSKIFYRYSKMNGLLTKFKMGRYEIKNNSTMLDIIETFVSGDSITTPVTIPEGKNIYEIAKILEAKQITSGKKFLEISKDPIFTRSLGIPSNTVEGYLYPDTYNFTLQTNAKTVIKTMVNLFKQKTKDIDFKNNTLGFNKHQIIILASIVEKETGYSKERPRIAGVFANRVKKRMRLQSDPTTVYGIFEKFNGNIKKKHLLQHTPYNTYKINGLPIGPISNPGLESIMATLSPEEHNYLYFVSQNNGEHVFSESYKKHVQAVNKYQKNRAMRKNRSWRDLNKKKKKEKKL